MAAIERIGKRRFQIDFAELKRKRLPWYKRMMPIDPATLEIDPLLITDALKGVMTFCNKHLADGSLLVWNEYRILLHQEDHDDLRNLQASLRDQFAQQLDAERQSLGASIVGDFTLRLQVDEAEELSPRIGVIEVDSKENVRLDHVQAVEGEMTIRLDRPAAGAVRQPRAQPQRVQAEEPPLRLVAGGGGRAAPPTGSTVRVDRSGAVAGTCTLQWTGGEATLAEGPRYLVGRESDKPITGYTHKIGLTGASNRISSRAFWVEVGARSATIGRPDHGSANAVSVNGELIEKGQAHNVSYPAQIQLTGGELTLILDRV